MKQVTTSIEEAGESAGLAEPLLETPAFALRSEYTLDDMREKYSDLFRSEDPEWVEEICYCPS